MPLAAPLLACLATGALSAALASPSSWQALKGDLHRIWMSILLGAAFSRLEPAARRRTFGAFLAGAAAAAMVGIEQVIQGRIATGLWLRAHGFIHPVTYGELIALGALGAAAWLADDETGASERGSGRGWAAAAGVLLLIALVVSETRGAAIGLGAGLLALGLAAPRRRRLAAAAVPLTLAVFLAADLLGQGTRRSLLRELFGGGPPEAPSVGQTSRLSLWSAGWRMFLDRPLIGVGPGNYREAYPRYSESVVNGERAMGSAHNLFLHHLAERGVLGLAATLWLLAALWTRAIRRARERPDALALWALSATAAFTIMNLTEVALQTEQAWLAFFFIWFLSDAREKA